MKFIFFRNAARSLVDSGFLKRSEYSWIAFCSWAWKAFAFTMTPLWSSVKEISGSVELTEAFETLLPRYTSGSKKGQCNNSVTAISQLGTVYGHGNVNF